LRKHLLYLTNTQLTAFMWQGGSIGDGQTFDNDEDGWKAFSELAGANRKVPAFLLTDLVEEDFQREVVPHVIGKARGNMLERRLANLYRDSVFRHASQQGRDKEGRRDDHILFSALTNASLLKPWLDAISKVEAPLAGIFSVALLSPLLFKKFGFDSTPLLLVSHQSSGLRQSFFHDGYLRFSRLTPLAEHSPESVAKVADQEMGKTRQFLTSTRLMPRGALIKIVILAQQEVLEQLQPLSPDTAEMLHRFVGLDEAAGVLGLKNLSDLAQCDRLFLAMLAGMAPASPYSQFEHSRLYTFWKARIALHAFSALTLLGGIAWGASNSVDWLEASSQTRQLEVDISTAKARHAIILRETPATVANPHDMKAAVELQQMLTQNSPSPNLLFAAIGQALDKQAQIKIIELRWQSSDPAADLAAPATGAAPAAGTGSAEPPLSPALIGVPKRPFEIVMIEGEVMRFHNDYRSALESVRQLAAELGKNRQLQVEIMRPPIDTRSEVKLEGKAGDDGVANRALFNLKLIWRP
jgi:hypothetical protein